ncbi:MAG: hypothetical protein HYY18_16790 [Planctomycetes bacterium]|nr:hypothetical protein [Planctomycetota bacterium]
MGKAIDYCASCGDRVSPADLEKGKAIAVQEKVYCPNCRSKAPQVPQNGSANGKTKGRTGSTGMFPSVRAGSPTTRSLPAVGASAQRVGHTSQRLPEFEEPPATQGPGKMPLIAGGAALVILLGAAILFFISNSKENALRDAEAKKQAEAKSAYEEFVMYGKERPEDPDGQLKLFADASRKCKGSEWSGKLNAERDDAERRKKSLEVRRERSGRLDGFRTRLTQTKDVPGLESLASDAKKFQQEMLQPGGDVDMSQQAASIALQAIAKKVQTVIDAAKEFEAQNSERHDEVIAKWSDALAACAEDERQVKLVQDRIKAAKERKEESAKRDWELAKVKVENARRAKKWGEAIEAIRAFTDSHKGSAIVDEATRLAWDIDADQKREDAARPPPDVKPPDPGMAAPKDWTVLFDDKTPGKWTARGAKAKWEVAGGVLTGANEVTAAAAALDKDSNGTSLYHIDRSYANYELEVDFTLVKGEVLFVAGLGGVNKDSPPAIPWRSKEVGNEASVLVGLDKPYVVSCKVTADAFTFKGNGIPEQGWRFAGSGDGKDRGAGVFGFALRPESEVRIRRIRIRAIQ